VLVSPRKKTLLTGVFFYASVREIELFVSNIREKKLRVFFLCRVELNISVFEG